MRPSIQRARIQLVRNAREVKVRLCWANTPLEKKTSTDFVVPQFNNSNVTTQVSSC